MVSRIFFLTLIKASLMCSAHDRQMKLSFISSPGVLSSSIGFPHKLHLKIIKITSLVSYDGLDVGVMVAGLDEAVKELVNIDGFMQMKGSAVPHQDRPCPGSVCCHSVNPPIGL